MVRTLSGPADGESILGDLPFICRTAVSVGWTTAPRHQPDFCADLVGLDGNCDVVAVGAGDGISKCADIDFDLETIAGVANLARTRARAGLPAMSPGPVPMMCAG